jgi:hypothetical protein
MHGPASCWKAAGRACACGSAGTLRVAGWSARALEDGPAALNDAARTSRPTWSLRCNRTRRRRTVDRPRAGLRHDDSPDRRRRCCRDLRRFRCNRNRRRRRRSNRCGRRSRCSAGCCCWSWRRRCNRTCNHWIYRRSRGDSWTLCCGRCRRRSSRHWRTSHHGTGRRLRSNSRRLWRGRSHDRRCLSRLRHNNASRSRRLNFGRGSRCARSWRCRSSSGRGWLDGLGSGRRRRLRPRRRPLRLFFTLLDRFENVAGLRHPRPVDLLGTAALALRRG